MAFPAHSPPARHDFGLSGAKPFELYWSRQERPQRFPSPPDIHRAVHFGVVMDGTVTTRLRNRVLELSAGDAYLVAPWEPHGTLARDTREIVLVSVDETELLRLFFTGGATLAALLQAAPEIRHKALNHPELRHHYRDFADRLRREPSPLRQWQAIFGVFIAIDARPEPEPGPAADRRLHSALEEMYRRDGAPLPPAEAAHRCGLGKDRFAHLFREAFGVSFGHFELRYRLANAAALLAEGRLSVKEVAARQGFCDAAHLCRVFRRHYGRTPGQWSGRQDAP